MKKLILLCCWFGSFAQKIESKIEKVVIYTSGAEVSRTAKIQIQKGRNDLVFAGISPQADPQSIQFLLPEQLTILSLNHHKTNSFNLEEARRLNTQKDEFELKLKSEQANLLVYKREEEMLLKNQVIGGAQSGTKIAELKEAIDFNKTRMQENLHKQLAIENDVQKWQAEIRKINQKLTELTTSVTATMGEILLSVSAKENQNVDIQFNYFLPNAGWKSLYDFRVENTQKPIKVTYKANIYQYSGENWKDVRLSLSNANPRKRNTPPDLRTLYAGTKNSYDDYYQNSTISNQTNRNEISGRVREKSTGEPILGVSVRLKNTNLGVSTDSEGNYKLHIPPNILESERILLFSFIGYISKETHAKNAAEVVLEEDKKTLEEVVVVGYGGVQEKRSITGAVASRTMGVQIPKTKQLIDLEEKEETLQQRYDILIPYTLPSDGKEYVVDLKEVEAQTEFEYFCVPKIDTDVFLKAKIPHWEQYGFQQGEANLYVEGIYLGKSNLELNQSDTLEIGLGRDKNISVSRKRIQVFMKKQFLGNDRIDSRAFEIRAKNLKKYAINLTIQDQFPISNNKAVTIEETEAKGANIEPTTGFIRWNLPLSVAEEKNVRLKYTIRSPKSGYVDVE